MPLRKRHRTNTAPEIPNLHILKDVQNLLYALGVGVTRYFSHHSSFWSLDTTKRELRAFADPGQALPPYSDRTRRQTGKNRNR